MKIVIIAIVALLVVGGGGAAAGMAFGVLPDVFGLFGGQQGASADGHGADAKEASVRDRLGPPPFLLSMKPIEIPVIMNGRVERRANFRFRLQVDPTATDILQTEGHRLHATMFEDLMVYLPRHLEDRDTVDLNAVKHRMRRKAQALLSAEVIKDVLIQSYFER